MGVARARGVAVVGVEGRMVEIEAHLATGLPGLALIGLPDTALHEARDRIRSAVVNSGEAWPTSRITVGMFPATLPKSGSGFDVAIAAALLAAAGKAPPDAVAARVLLGELSLDGRLRPVRGILPAVLAAARHGAERVVVPVGNAAEAMLVTEVAVEPVPTLACLLRLLRGEITAADLPAVEPLEPPDTGGGPDLADVAGQTRGRLAVEVAAAGGHHLFMQGPPGSGKTMLAERLPWLLPPLDEDAAIEVTAIHSVAGILPAGCPLVTLPPFRAPHHTATPAALIGGGSSVVRPGLASQAHRGVLFLDEAPEFAARCVDALRQPLESGVIDIARARSSARFPARFMLVLAANPCPCSGARAGPDQWCDCSPRVRRGYLGRLSGPLLDRVDLQVELAPPSRAEMLADAEYVEGSDVVAKRVRAARAAAAARLASTGWRTNAEVPGPELRRRWPVSRVSRREADRAFEAGWLTARGLDRVLRVAWTLADLSGLDTPGATEVGIALDMRLARQP